MRYFFFGTLMDWDVLEAVIGHPPDDVRLLPARLAGWKRVKVRGEAFPMLIQQPWTQVDGMVAEGLSAADIARIRFFEDVEYVTQVCHPTLASGQRIDAVMHVSTEALYPSTRPWDFDEWRMTEKTVYLAMAREWMGLYDRRADLDLKAAWAEIHARHGV